MDWLKPLSIIGNAISKQGIINKIERDQLEREYDKYYAEFLNHCEELGKLVFQKGLLESKKQSTFLIDIEIADFAIEIFDKIVDDIKFQVRTKNNYKIFIRDYKEARSQVMKVLDSNKSSDDIVFETPESEITPFIRAMVDNRNAFLAEFTSQVTTLALDLNEDLNLFDLDEKDKLKNFLEAAQSHFEKYKYSK
ncbi:hypothetical protein COL11_09880 [Bacillus anthracis]|nr:hypothetical protein COL11_09880 [Bacillus anthracis]